MVPRQAPLPASPGFQQVHRRGDSGSPRVTGSTKAVNAGSTPGSVTVTARRPPPGRRIRSAAAARAFAGSRNSRRPAWMVTRASPMARATRLTPPLMLLVTALVCARVHTGLAAGSGTYGAPALWPDDCNDSDVCNAAANCSTNCYPDEISFENGYPITCGDFNGGPDGGECDGDSDPYLCAGCENAQVSAYVNFTDGGVDWSTRFANWPDPNQVGNCSGNCGPGCNGWSVCSENPNYWQLTVTGSVTTDTSDSCFCIADGVESCGTDSFSQQSGTWTYNGIEADGCVVHDDACRSPWWESVLIDIFYAAVDWSGPWWQYLLNPFVSCADFSAFTVGACYDATDYSWSWPT